MLGAPEVRAETARTLRDDARQLLADTGLFALVQARFGEPVVTGSASYDLMVWRDIDIDLAIEAERWSHWLAFAGEIAAQLDAVGLTLGHATYINAHAEANPVGVGLCWSLGFNDFAGFAWQVDLWGWDPFDYAVRQARDFSLRTDLLAADRDLVLRLKTEARARPNYFGIKVTSFDIYEFVIAKAGDSLAVLEQWKAKHK